MRFVVRTHVVGSEYTLRAPATTSLSKKCTVYNLVKKGIETGYEIILTLRKGEDETSLHTNKIHSIYKPSCFSHGHSLHENHQNHPLATLTGLGVPLRSLSLGLKLEGLRLDLRCNSLSTSKVASLGNSSVPCVSGIPIVERRRFRRFFSALQPNTTSTRMKRCPEKKNATSRTC